MERPSASMPSQPPRLRLFRSPWLVGEHRFWLLATWLLGFLAVAKGIRQPSSWAATQAQVDYTLGFTKRGLLGAVYGVFGIHHYRPLDNIFLVELAILFVVLALLIRQSRIIERFGTPMVVALFASSYCVTFLAHLIGYSEITNLTLAIFLLLVRSVRIRFVLAIPLVTIALLSHENFLFLFFPAVLFSFYLNGELAPAKAERRLAWLFGLLTALLGACVTLFTSARASLSPQQSARLEAIIEQRVDFPVYAQFFKILSTSASGNLHLMAHVVRHERFWWTGQVLSVFVLLPIVLVLISLFSQITYSALPSFGAASLKRLRLIILFAVLAPLSIHAIGSDEFRWNVLCVFSAYLVLLTLSLHLPRAPIALLPGQRHAIILVIAIQMATGFGMFEDYQITPYPFLPPLLHFFEGHHPPDLSR